mmetsp:Transcript_5960/g.21248  ORF Transcript_5960/g.21248 Transcript_5960/m.21248 type:complete len:337 (+) Transcript_5960:777-1787(+)
MRTSALRRSASTAAATAALSAATSAAWVAAIARCSTTREFAAAASAAAASAAVLAASSTRFVSARASWCVKCSSDTLRRKRASSPAVASTIGAPSCTSDTPSSSPSACSAATWSSSTARIASDSAVCASTARPRSSTASRSIVIVPSRPLISSERLATFAPTCETRALNALTVAIGANLSEPSSAAAPSPAIMARARFCCATEATTASSSSPFARASATSLSRAETRRRHFGISAPSVSAALASAPVAARSSASSAPVDPTSCEAVTLSRSATSSATREAVAFSRWLASVSCCEACAWAPRSVSSCRCRRVTWSDRRPASSAADPRAPGAAARRVR